MRWPQPGRPQKTGRKTVAHGGRMRHSARPGARPREPAQLPAAGPHAGQTRRPRPACG
jgi:hypothetical protein